MQRRTGLCCAALALAALVLAERPLDDEPLFEEDENSWSRTRRDIADADFEEPEEWTNPKRSISPDRSEDCCRYDYEPASRPRRELRRLRQYEVHEDTGDEPQWTAPLFGHEDLAGEASDQRPREFYADSQHRRPAEAGAPAPARYLFSEPEDVEAEDQMSEGTSSHHKSAGRKGYDAGGGSAYNGNHNSEKDGSVSKGYKTSEHSDKGAQGHKKKHLHKNEYEESEGAKKQHHDNAGHEGHHEEEAQGHKGAKFDEKKGHKKGHKTKGYHNKYHKDEFHKEHKFYDDYHKGGSHHRYGKFHAKHASDEGGRKQAHRVDAAHDAQHKGTKGFSNKGHSDSDHRGHNTKQGHAQHSARQHSQGRQSGHQGGSKYGYKKN